MTDIQDSWAEKEATNYALKNASGDEKTRAAVLAGMKLVSWGLVNEIERVFQHQHVPDEAWSAFDHIVEWLTSKTDINTENMIMYCDKV